MSDLATAFEFTPDDLIYNRAGTLSPRQQAEMRRLRGFLFWGMGLCLVALIGVWGGNIGEGSICFALVIVFMFALVTYAWINSSQALQENTVIYVEGAVQLRQHGRRHYVQIEDREYAVNLRRFEALEEGKIYRIYFTPKYDLILAIEQL